MDSIRSVVGRTAGFVAAALIGAACGKGAPAAPATPPAPPATPTTWTQSATQFRAQTGQTLSFMCPPNGTPGSVWGSDLYSDDSSICTAALHSGRVTLAAGGIVSIVIAPGAPAYLPTMRNGVTTRPWGAWTGSFTIVGGAAPGLVAVPVGAAVPTPPPPPPVVANGAPTPVTWSTNGASIAPLGQSVLAGCPPNGMVGSMWGTDVYTSDSSVCSAAVHMGLITAASGGVVRVTGAPGLPAYPGTARNGVTSSSWPSYGSSFTVMPGMAGK